MTGRIDGDVEGFKDYEKERDQPEEFTRGHNHNFGAFALEGETGAHEKSPMKLSFLPFPTGGLNGAQESLFETGH